MRDGLRKLRHAGTHLGLPLFLFPLLVPHAPFSTCALFSSFLVFLPLIGYGGHRSPIATGGTSGEPQEEYLLLKPPESLGLRPKSSKKTRKIERNSTNRLKEERSCFSHIPVYF